MSQPLLNFTPPVDPLPSVPYQAGSPTSKSGAQVAQPKAGTQTAEILATIQRLGPISDQDLVLVTGYAINIVTARRNRLLNDGWITLAGTEVGPSGAHRQTWRVSRAEPTEAGAASHPLRRID